jgi:hypothetical protein
MWKKLWKIKAPRKMVITLWRMAHNCLPTGHQLRRRQIPASDACVFCNREERVEHAMLFCQYAYQVWRDVKATFRVHLRKKEFTNIKVWIFDFLARVDDRAAVTLAVTAWHIWNAWNVFVMVKP